MNGRLLAAVAALGVALLSPGPFANDDFDQAYQVWNVEQGHLGVQERPAWLALWGDKLTVAPRTEGPIVYASLPLSLLTVGVAWVERGIDLVVPIQVAAGLVFTALAWTACGLPWPGTQRAPWKTGNAWASLAGLLAVSWWAAPWTTPRNLDMDLFWPYVALASANLLLLVATAAMLDDLARRRIPSQGLRTALLVAILAGPVAFWGLENKYHMLAIATATAALWLLDRPSTRRNALALGAVAAIALWNHPGAGSVVVVGVLAAMWRRKPAWVAAGLVLAAIPMLAENQALHGNPFLNVYTDPPPLASAEFVVAPETDASPANATDPIASAPPLAQSAATRPPLDDRLKDAFDWEGPGTWLARLWAAFTTARGIEGTANGVLAISPLLALAFKPLRRSHPTRLFAWTLVASHAILWTNAGAYQGYGHDVRYWSVALPALGLLAMDAAPVVQDTGRHVAARWLGGSLVVGLAALALLVAAERTFHPFDDAIHLQRAQGLLLAIGAAAAALALASGRILHRPAGVAMAAALAAVPLAWLLLRALVVPDGLYAYGDSQRVPFLLPGMEAVAEWAQRLFASPDVIPNFYDASDPG